MLNDIKYENISFRKEEVQKYYPKISEEEETGRLASKKSISKKETLG
jgi:hypothetical protein